MPTIQLGVQQYGIVGHNTIFHGPELHWYYRRDPQWLAWRRCWKNENMKSGLPRDLSDRYGLKTFKNANFYHTEVKVMLWEEGESRIVFCGNHHFNTAPPSTALRRQIDCLTQILIKLEVFYLSKIRIRKQRGRRETLSTSSLLASSFAPFGRRRIESCFLGLFGVAQKWIIWQN